MEKNLSARFEEENLDDFGGIARLFFPEKRFRTWLSSDGRQVKLFTIDREGGEEEEGWREERCRKEKA
jgi:hypothetical protein